MKKIILMLVIFLTVGSATSVLAKSENAGSGLGTGVVAVSPTGTVTGTANQNRVQTKNAGEEQQLMVNTAEQEEAGVGLDSAKVRNEVAIQHMSDVAKGVQELLASRTLKGGVGDQVRLLAQDQEKSQDQIRLQVDKVASRGGLLKTLFGSNYSALKGIQEQISQNELRIQQLTELKNQLTNAGDVTLVQEMINSLIQQNTSLQSMVDAELGQKSVLGWLIRLFIK